jgi:hypothetical protein
MAEMEREHAVKEERWRQQDNERMGRFFDARLYRDDGEAGQGKGALAGRAASAAGALKST